MLFENYFRRFWIFSLSRIPSRFVAPVQLLSLGELKPGRKWDSRVSRKRISRVGWCIATGGKRQKLTMPAFTGDLEPGGCRFVGVRAFVLTRVHAAPPREPSTKRPGGLQMGNKTVADFFSPFFLIFFLSFFSHLSDSSPSLRNAWNDNAWASSFKFSLQVRFLKKRIDGWRKICETGEKVKRCELAERRRFPIYVNFNFPFVLISRYLPFDRSICVINNVTSTSDVTINSGG